MATSALEAKARAVLEAWYCISSVRVSERAEVTSFLAYSPRSVLEYWRGNLPNWREFPNPELGCRTLWEPQVREECLFCHDEAEEGVHPVEDLDNFAGGPPSG